MQRLFQSATCGMFEIVRTNIISETITESTFKVRFLGASRLYHTGIYSIKELKSTQMKRVWYYKISLGEFVMSVIIIVVFIWVNHFPSVSGSSFGKYDLNDT